MKTLRRRSSDRMQSPVHERDTLLPCAACNGSGSRMVERGSHYQMRKCRWCEGLGAWTRYAQQLFVRWLRIAQAHRIARL